MKKTLIVLCSVMTMALVGCDKNRGGAGTDSDRTTGYGSSRDNTYPSSRSVARDTNTTSINAPSSSVTTNTNSTTTAPAETPSDNYGTQPK